MAKQSIAETVRSLLEPVIDEIGYDVWDVEYVKEGASFYLRITIDSEKGIDIDDCEKVHRIIDPLIDEADPIEDSYYLQVSSPGIERTLSREEHLDYGIGKKIDIKLFNAINKKKMLRGTLLRYDAEKLYISENDAELSLERKNVSKINIHFDFGDEE